MAFDYDIINENEVQKVILSGRLDSNTSSLLENKLLGLFEVKGRIVLMDFSALDYISSAGIRVVIMAAKKAKHEQGRFILCNLNENVKTVFDISGLLTSLEIIENQDALLDLLAVK